MAGPCISPPTNGESSNRPENRGRSSSTVAIAAGTVGGIVGLVIIVVVCVCIAVWLSRRVRVKEYFIGRNGLEKQNVHSGINSNAGSIPASDTANRQASDNASISHAEERNVWMNKGIRSKSRDESHDRTENKSGDSEQGTMSHINIAYHRSNVAQGKAYNTGYLTMLAEGETPTQQNQSVSNDDDDAYESVT